MAKFHAKGSFKIDRNGLRTVIFGDIVDGTIRHGMKIHIRFNDSLSMTSEIEAVELVDRITDRVSHVALVLRVEEDADEEADLFASLNVGDEVLEVTEP